MRNKLKMLALAGLFAGSTSAVNAITIDFESFALGTYSSLSTADFTITYTGGNGQFNVVSADPGSPISGNALISYFLNPGPAPFRVDFTTAVSAFSIGVGDYNADVDNTFLQAYSASDVLLGSDSYINPAATYGGDFMSVSSATPISYVLFGDNDPFAGAVYWDQMSYSATSVPEPTSLALFGIGLAGLGLARRRRI